MNGEQPKHNIGIFVHCILLAIPLYVMIIGRQSASNCNITRSNFVSIYTCDWLAAAASSHHITHCTLCGVWLCVCVCLPAHVTVMCFELASRPITWFQYIRAQAANLFSFAPPFAINGFRFGSHPFNRVDTFLWPRHKANILLCFSKRAVPSICIVDALSKPAPVYLLRVCGI